MSKRVWILGAGFSAPLGGPLLTDLFSTKMESALKAHYDRVADQNDPKSWIAVNLFRWGLGEPFAPTGTEHTLNGSRLWTNAEEYLDRLDSARSSSNPAEDVIREAIEKLIHGHDEFVHVLHIIRKWIDQNRKLLVEQVALASKQWMAAECCVFLEDVDLNTERWTPYKNWAESLTVDDTIITFNYDRVLETLIEHKHGDLAIVDPVECVTAATTLVFKLHGSVDWKYSVQERKFHVTDEPDACMSLLLESFGMATPGPSKKIATGALKKLWSLAIGHLESADNVFFLGYRFPETDTEAMRALLLAMRRGSHKRDRLTEVVLGPDTSDDRVQRLQGLIAWTLGSAQAPRPLYAQDFMTLYAMGTHQGDGKTVRAEPAGSGGRRTADRS
ncbi:MAG: hypothetical protein ACI8P0_005701 [Planctomycetaceae bacterium]